MHVLHMCDSCIRLHFTGGISTVSSVPLPAPPSLPFPPPPLGNIVHPASSYRLPSSHLPLPPPRPVHSAFPVSSLNQFRPPLGFQNFDGVHRQVPGQPPQPALIPFVAPPLSNSLPTSKAIRAQTITYHKPGNRNGEDRLSRVRRSAKDGNQHEENNVLTKQKN